MQIRAFFIGCGLLAAAMTNGSSEARVQAVQQRLPLVAAHRLGAYEMPALQKGAKTAPKPAAQTVKNLTFQQVFDYQMKSSAAGKAAAGRPIFEKQCATCHRFGSVGNEVGPDLSTLKSRFQKKDVLESVLWPSRAVSDQYHAIVIETKDGQSQTGVVAREDTSRLLLKEYTQQDITNLVTFLLGTPPA